MNRCGLNVMNYKGSAPRAAGAARYARARKISSKCERGQKEEVHDLVLLTI